MTRIKNIAFRLVYDTITLTAQYTIELTSYTQYIYIDKNKGIKTRRYRLFG